ncbi:MAG: flagellar M-ring protein FliF C-terminal domain-containing protein [Candidatus Neomarinimicrobiota bacterium]|nr:flagellar M-ring protein FliF C-terminal domain-containing protein [Candidatus Neomarinimicrobiota bacterium]
MNKGVDMVKRSKRVFIFTLTLGFIVTISLGQTNGYLAQKLMIENDLRKRIANALEKVIDNRKYVVDVSVDLEISSAIENQTTYSPGGGDNTLESLQGAENLLNAADTPPRGSVGLPIPGFDFTAEPPTKDAEAASNESAPMESPSKPNVLSRTQTETRPAMASVRNMEISIIIQEGAAPELIENIRQVVMVASRFNRPRGDVLSIMTASFKERRDQKSAEQVLLKNIAEKLESLESQRERLGEVDWQQELENYKDSEAERRTEDRLYFQSKLAEFETVARDQSYDQERQAMLSQDSVRLQALNEEIQNLKAFLGTADLTDSATTEVQSSVQQKLQEKESLDSQIAEKLAMLDQVQSDLDNQPRSSSNTGMVIFVSLLSALVFILVVVLVFILMNKPKQQMPVPPWMMYPPRPKKKDDGNNREVPKPAVAPPMPEPQQSIEDISVLQSEVNDMKQAVVSMSVGQPQAATKIVKDWILEEAPPEPEPTPEVPEEDDGGKKKKKKKKK